MRKVNLVKTFSIKLFIAVSIIGGFYGCGTGAMMVKMIKNYPVANKFLIHKNPQVGDYAIIETKGPISKQVKHEVFSVKNDLIGIKTHVLDTHYIEIFTDREGTVKKAAIVDKETGEKDRLMVAKKGQYGYTEFHKLDEKVILQTAIGEFECDVIYTSIDMTKTGFAGYAFSVYFISDDVKFLQVKNAGFRSDTQGSISSYAVIKNNVNFLGSIIEQGHK
ncbi:MAG: hypothetical protein OEZ13_13750 [Spirochaetia bacterium]|nr:hypothetical protein [Spirochaetia bacterium]